MLEEKFNPLYIVGKTRNEAKEYLEKHNIQYYFESSIITNCKTALFTSYKEGTHFYKIYDYNSKNKDEDLILSFEGVQGFNHFQNYNDLNFKNNISGLTTISNT